MDEVDLFADVGVLEAETAVPAEKKTEQEENPKAYQLVDLHDGSYVLKKYNGYKSTPKYFIIGHFRLRSKHFQQFDKSTSVHQRKREAKALGNATVRRAETNVLKQAHELVSMINSEYEFELKINNGVEMTDYLANLIVKITEDLNAKYKKDKLAAEIEMLDKLASIELNKDNVQLSDEQAEKIIMAVNRLYYKVESFCEKQNKNKQKIIESYHKKLHEEIMAKANRI